MKCKKCGSKIDESVATCPFCGDKVEISSADSTIPEAKDSSVEMVKCNYCGSSISSDSNNCPYCGMKVDHRTDDITTVIPATTKPISTGRFASYRKGSDSVNGIIFASVSLVLSIISFFILGFLSFIATGLSISGLVFSLRGRKNGDNTIVGLILSVIALVLSIVMVVLYILALITVASGQV